MNSICGAGGSCNQMQMQGMRQRKGPAERFDQLDADKNGGIDQAELQPMADKISEVTGQNLSVEEVTKTYDANNDGLLGQDEMQSMMMDLSAKVGGGQDGQFSAQSLAAYQTDAEDESFSALMEMFGEESEEEDDYYPVDIQA